MSTLHLNDAGNFEVCVRIIDYPRMTCAHENEVRVTMAIVDQMSIFRRSCGVSDDTERATVGESSRATMWHSIPTIVSSSTPSMGSRSDSMQIWKCATIA